MLFATSTFAGEICHSAAVGQDRTPIRFCVDPEDARVTRYEATRAQTAGRFEQRRAMESIDGVLTLRPTRLDGPQRIISRYLTSDLPGNSTPFSKKGQAAYQVCDWNFLEGDCMRQEPTGAQASRCWKRCSNWFQYMPGQETGR